MAVNLRFTVNWCVLGYSNNLDFIPTCHVPCRFIQNPLAVQLLETYDSNTFEFCSALDSNFVKNYIPCATCLDGSGNQTFQANCKSRHYLYGPRVVLCSFRGHSAAYPRYSVVRALYQACIQRPKRGSTVSLSMDLFKDNAPQTTIPTTNPTIPSASPTRTSVNSIAAPVASAVSNGNSGKSNHLAPGAVAGIGIGASVVALGVLAAAFNIFIRKHRQRAHRHEEPVRQKNEELSLGELSIGQTGYADAPSVIVGGSTRHEIPADAAHSRANELPDQPLEHFDTTISTSGQQTKPASLHISELAAGGINPPGCIDTRPPC